MDTACLLVMSYIRFIYGKQNENGLKMGMHLLFIRKTFIVKYEFDRYSSSLSFPHAPASVR